MKLLIVVTIIGILLFLVACPSTPVIKTYTLSITINGNGTVTKSPDKSNYNSGAAVTLTAVPSENWEFINWGGGMSGSSNPATITMSSNKNITANFEEIINEYTLTLRVTGQGTVAVAPEKNMYQENEEVILTAIPDNGWQFSHWIGDVENQSNPTTIFIDENEVATAVFLEDIQTTYTLNITKEGNGSVHKNPDKGEYFEGEEVIITAEASPGWEFIQWELDYHGPENPATVTMDFNKNIHTIFQNIINEYTLTLGVTGQGTVAAAPEKDFYNYNEEVVLTAIPDNGWHFSHWIGDVENQFNPTTIFIDENELATAVFVEEIQATYTLTITKEGNGSVHKNPDKAEYTEGEEVTITAESSPGWEFLQWELDYIGTANPATVTMDFNKNIHAVFQLKTYSLVVNINGGGNVNIDPDKPEYTHGEGVELTAIPNAEWYFDHWEGDLSGSINPEFITMNSNKEITAEFCIIPNASPTIEKVSGPEGDLYENNQTFDWMGSDTDGTIVGYEYRKDGGSWTPTTNTQYTWSSITTGSHKFEARAKDDKGAYSNIIEWNFTFKEVVIDWQKCLGGTFDDVSYSLQKTTDGGFIVAGNTMSNDGDVSGNHGEGDYWIVKLDSEGNKIWQKCLGGSKFDVATSFKQVSDGNYIVAGYSLSNDGDVSGNHGEYDAWIIKINSERNKIWQKCLGGSNWDFLSEIQQTDDNGYIIVGTTNSNDGDVSGNHGISDYWVVKLDSIGNLTWQKCFGGSFDDSTGSILQTADGGYIVAGSSPSNDGDVSGNHGGFDCWIVKINSEGTKIWQKCYGGSNWDFLSVIQQTDDNGYIMAGSTKSNDGDVAGNHGGYDYWIVKLDNVGNIIWQKCFGGSNEDELYSLEKTTDGGYILAGRTNSNDGDVSGNHGGYDYWIVKLDNVGNIIWQKCFGGSDWEEACKIFQISDGEYIVSGYSKSSDGDVAGNHGENDFWVLKISENP